MRQKVAPRHFMAQFRPRPNWIPIALALAVAKLYGAGHKTKMIGRLGPKSPQKVI
jgi:hypothetical protein